MTILATLISLIQPALGVIGAFQGSATQARIATQIQDAMGVFNAVKPLIDQFTSGTEVTPEQVRAALDRFPDALAVLDAEIAKAKAEGR